jgi:hypothetical protein
MRPSESIPLKPSVDAQTQCVQHQEHARENGGTCDDSNVTFIVILDKDIFLFNCIFIFFGIDQVARPTMCACDCASSRGRWQRQRRERSRLCRSERSWRELCRCRSEAGKPLCVDMLKGGGQLLLNDTLAGVILASACDSLISSGSDAMHIEGTALGQQASRALHLQSKGMDVGIRLD